MGLDGHTKRAFKQSDAIRPIKLIFNGKIRLKCDTSDVIFHLLIEPCTLITYLIRYA